MTITPPPTLAGFESFVRTYMGINTTVLPVSSVYTSDSFQVAVELCNSQINCVSPVLYTTAVYNLAGATLVQTAQDVGGPPPPVYKDDLPYFAYLRKFYTITSFVGGTIQSTSDESTSESLNVPENLKNLTLMDLALLKTPWGQAYLAIAEQYGTIWGIS